jgi:oligo-1,6-glucosidase
MFAFDVCRTPLFILGTLALAVPLCALPSAADEPLVNGFEPKWWKEAVVYQVYPRSFKDSNDDGIGDLNGITSKLDYLQQLGVTVIWLSPHYDSPNIDNGYDIRDYRKVMADFGTMADFDRMLAEIKKRHMRLIIDLVVNHTSDEHAWFEESRKSLHNPFRDYYIWRSGKPNANAPHGFDPPNNYPSYFSGSAWQFDPPTRQFYLHLFAVKQPDLNWENVKVRQEVYGLMRFWLDKGVDGFRMDVIPLISKQPGLPDLTVEQLKDPSRVFANGPKRDQYLQEMNHEVLSQYDDMSVGEAIGITLSEQPKLIGQDRHELNMVFNFDAPRINRGAGYASRNWTLQEFKKTYSEHASVLGKTSWDTVFLANHDNPRMVSNFGDDSAQFRAPSAKLLQTMLLTLRGTPFLYQGDELGMTNYPFKLNEFDDVEVKNLYKAAVLTGQMTEEEYLAQARRFGRDNSRTPMQWNSSANAGFCSATAKPWIVVNPNYKEINAAHDLADGDSVFHFTQQVIALHRANRVFTYGDYHDLDPANPQVFAYTRTLGEAKFLIVLNFSGKPIHYSLPGGLKAKELVLGNLPQNGSASDDMSLRPWEARIYRF